ncbi:hypothetical protein LCGC14_2784880, partial [marine sediment metagenome]
CQPHYMTVLKQKTTVYLLSLHIWVECGILIMEGVYARTNTTIT